MKIWVQPLPKPGRTSLSSNVHWQKSIELTAWFGCLGKANCIWSIFTIGGMVFSNDTHRIFISKSIHSVIVCVSYIVEQNLNLTRAWWNGFYERISSI
jgi:hypothetical protein